MFPTLAKYQQKACHVPGPLNSIIVQFSCHTSYNMSCAASLMIPELSILADDFCEFGCESVIGELCFPPIMIAQLERMRYQYRTMT